MQEAYRRIPLEQLRESPSNPRRLYAEQPLNELAASIKAHDVVQPILTRPHPTEAEVFEIVVGSRRFRGSKIAQRFDIPAVVRELTDEQVVAIQAIENIQREDVHPLEEASSYKMLVALGREVEEIATQLGKSATYIYQRMKLADLCPEAQKAYLTDKFTTAHAVQLARLPVSAQKELLELFEQYEPGEITTANLQQEIEQQYYLDLHRAAFKKNDALLVPEAGPCTTCQKRTGFVPMLFPDIKRKDTCTDRGCFQSKLAAHIQRVRTELAKDGATVPLLSILYSPHAKPQYPEALLHGKWAEATKKCKHTLSGVIIDGHETGKVTACCLETSCSVHRAQVDAKTATVNQRATRGAPTSQQKAAIDRENAKRAAKERGIAAVVQKTKSLNGPDLKMLAKALATEMWHESLKSLCKHRGWEPKKNQYNGKDYKVTALAEIDKMDNVTVAGFLMECVLRGRMMLGEGGDFVAEAKRHGVDITKLEKDALDEAKAKAKAKLDKQKARNNKTPHKKAASSK